MPAHATHRPLADHASVTPSIFDTPAVFSIDAVSLLWAEAAVVGSFFGSPVILDAEEFGGFVAGVQSYQVE